MSNIIVPSRKLAKPIWEALPGSQSLFLQSPIREVCFSGTRGPGKRLSLETKILTDSGWKTAGEITFKDLLVSMDGTYCNVTGIFPCDNRPLYNVEFFDGKIIEADDEHRWRTLNSKQGYKEGWKVKTTEEIRLALDKNTVGYSIPYLQGAIPGKKWEGVDPYLLGYIIANGTTGSKQVTIYSIDDEILNHAKDTHGWFVHQYEGQTAKRAVCPSVTDETWRKILGHHIGDEKFVPKELLQADAATRLAILQGLMDGDGNYEKGAQTRYSTVSEQLAKDVVELVKSLGGWATYAKRVCMGEHYETIKGKPYNSRGYIYRVNISHHNHFNPFRLKRKADRVLEQKKFLTRGIKSITYSRHGAGVCFAVDHPSHCFVIEDYVVTHNTDAMLMAFAQYCGRGYGDYWRGIIFRRNYKHLDDIIAKSKRWFNQSAQKPRFLAGASSLKWVWPTGEELLLRAFEDEEDYWSFHGHEYPFIGWEEVTSWPSIGCYESMKSCNRSSFQATERLATIPRLIRSSTNPYGVGHNWVKNYFVDPAPYGHVITDPKGNKRVCLFGSIKENPYLGEEYIQTLESITDPNKRKAWLEGSWDITSGGMFDDLWNKDKHVLKGFDIPFSWKIDRSFDWGSSKPFSVGWWAQTDGTDATMKDGTTRSFPAKTLIRIGEWYGSTGKPNEGLRMTARNVALGIAAREIQLGIQNRVHPGPADSAIYAVTDDASIGQNMENESVFWVPADKRPGSRKNGWELIRDRLDAVVNPETQDKPGMYVFDTCRDFIRTMPPIPRDTRDPDDIDTDAEDHIADEVRYRVLALDAVVKKIRLTGT